MAAAGTTGDSERRRWILCTLVLLPFTHDNKETEAIVRCSPGEDGTNGFFVSCFVRRSHAHVSVGETEMAIAGRKLDPVATSAKRKLQIEGERDRTSVPLTLGGQRKKRKKRSDRVEHTQGARS
jgi:hypothetical protein